MARFLKNILLFSLLIVAGLAACEVNSRRQPHPLKYQDEYICKRGTEISRLIIGPSSIWWGVDPAMFPNDSVFTIAYNGQHISRSLHALEHYLPYMPNLREIVIGILPCTFFDHTDMASKNYEGEIAYAVHSPLAKHPIWSPYNYTIFFPANFRQRLLPWKEKQDTMYDGLGHATSSPTHRRSRHWRNSARWLRSQHVAEDYDFVGYNVANMCRLLELCRDHGVNVTVVATPVHSEYTEMIPRPQMALHYSIIRGLQQDYGFRFRDYSEDSRITDDAFYDVVHLSTDVGAAQFLSLIHI